MALANWAQKKHNPISPLKEEKRKKGNRKKKKKERVAAASQSLRLLKPPARGNENYPGCSTQGRGNWSGLKKGCPGVHRLLLVGKGEWFQAVRKKARRHGSDEKSGRAYEKKRRYLIRSHRITKPSEKDRPVGTDPGGDNARPGIFWPVEAGPSKKGRCQSSLPT